MKDCQIRWSKRLAMPTLRNKTFRKMIVLDAVAVQGNVPRTWLRYRDHKCDKVCRSP